MIFTGWVFCLWLWFIKSINRNANRFLALALLVMILWMLRVLHITMPTQLLLAVGPLLYFYVRKITQPQSQFRWQDLLHLSPLSLWLVPSPFLQIMIFSSVMLYLYRSYELIQRFYKALQLVLMDRSLLEFQWLQRLLAATAFLWIFWLFSELGLPIHGSVYSFFAVMIIWMAAAAILKPQAGLIKQTSVISKPVSSAIKQQGIWLKKAMEVNLFYQDPDLNLRSLAETLDLNPNELSRIINTAFGKSFNDFINEYRIREVTRKMLDPAYDRITLLGIAMDAGFNSKSTFNRTFRQMTGKSPAEYKSRLKKERPYCTLRPYSRSIAIISSQEATQMWSSEKLNRSYMFKNYVKIAFRNMAKNKLYSFINIAGLAVGMTSAILIFLWVQDEIGHDRFFTNIDRIYLMNGRAKLNNGDFGLGVYTPKPMAPAIKNDYPEVEESVRVRNAHFLISNGDKHFGALGNLVDSRFLQLFDFQMLEGNTATALDSVNNIVLTQHLAKKLFGNQDALGKIVKLDSVNYAIVTGILKDLPGNTSFDFEYLVPWSYAVKLGWNDNDWNNNSVYTYALLKPGASLKAFNSKVSDILIKHTKPDNVMHVFAQPYKDAWLYSSVENGNYVAGRIKEVRMFIIIAIFILLIACINFINLSTARSEKRAKEVGIRKVVGAQKHMLVIQFIGEGILLAFAAGLIAAIIVLLVLPTFNLAINENLTIKYNDPLYYLYLIIFILFAGIAAGAYPAFLLSSFKPVKVLKGTLQPIRALVTPRKVLVVVQFTFAIVFMICTIIVEGQIKYAENRDAGYSRNNLAFVYMTGEVGKQYRLIRHDLLNSGAATTITATSGPMTELWSNSSGYTWPGSDANDQKTIFNLYSADDDFSKTMRLSVLQGRDINLKDYPTDSTALLLNETALKMMHLKYPIGTIVKGNGKTLHVVGVVRDFILESPYAPIHPMLIMGPVFPFDVINFRLDPHKRITESVAKTEKIFKKYNPNYPFDIHYYDKEYALKFADEQREGTLAGLFAGLAIFISCLGLFGLVTYMVENRVKEIGIRKVLGAGAASVVGLFSGEFLKLIIISFVIASPVAWYIMHKWLLSYEYRITISWWMFACTGILSLLIAMLTISFQAIKAALANPVKSLRSE